MTFRKTNLTANCAAILLLAGCAGSAPNSSDAIYSAPPATATPYRPPESYIIQRAPTYAAEDIYEIQVAEAARQEAEDRRLALAALEAQSRSARTPILGTEFAPAEPAPTPAPVPGPDQSAIAEAEARASAAEAQAIALARQLAEARAAVREAEAAAEQAESAAQRAIRARVEALAAERQQAAAQGAAQDRANPAVPRRPILGGFATRPADAPQQAQRTPPPPAAAPRAATPAPAAPPPSRPIVEQAPIPGLKPYILARSAIPSVKPRRAPKERPFRVASAPELGTPTASTPPTNPAIAREPGSDLGARFFPTPGKPSTLGTDRDAPLDLVSIDAAPYGVGSELVQKVEAGGEQADWADAVRLIESGEVEALAIQSDSDLVLTLCSGRSILTTPPDLTAAATLTAPQIICGQNKPLALR